MSRTCREEALQITTSIPITTIHLLPQISPYNPSTHTYNPCQNHPLPYPVTKTPPSRALRGAENQKTVGYHERHQAPPAPSIRPVPAKKRVVVVSHAKIKRFQ